MARIFGLGFFLAATLWIIAAETSTGHTDSFSTTVAPVLGQYCSKCHGAVRPKAGVNLTSFTNTIAVYRDPRLWEKVVAKLKDGEMPPEGKPQPSADQRSSLLGWVHQTLADLEEGRFPPDPGRVLIHRLSRTEYNCTIRDLFGIDSKPADSFPSEGGGGGGFDNNADTLFIPPLLMERYLAAATRVLDQAPHDTLFFVKGGFFTSDRSRARQIIEHFARLGFRRPPESAEIERLLVVYERAEQSGQPFESAVKKSLSAILISPHFLFRIESDQNKSGPYRITDYELANRLSYFLWSSMPDAELFALAADNRLHDPSVLERQVSRMLRDPKSKVFSDNFAGQWLRVRELKSAAQPDPTRFPGFTPALREAMYQEVIQFFDSILRDDTSMLQLLSADYSFLNEDLAALYGVEGVHGSALTRVKLSNPERGGVLGMGAVLTLTSYPLRTSPVLRGKWVLEQILGTPPPPPPPLVKSLPQDDAPVDGLTLRQQLEKHREKAECAACHQKMDPLGFGLENYDPIGRWRTQIGKQVVDASGVLPDGAKFTGPAELKQLLLAKKDDFARNITEKALAYALGRGLEYYDMPTVKRIAKTLADNGYRSSVLITEIAKSFPFQYRRNQPSESAANSSSQ